MSGLRIWGITIYSWWVRKHTEKLALSRSTWNCVERHPTLHLSCLPVNDMPLLFCLGHLPPFRCVCTTFLNIIYSKSNHIQMKESSMSEKGSHSKTNPARRLLNCLLSCFEAYLEWTLDGDQKWASLHQALIYCFPWDSRRLWDGWIASYLAWIKFQAI